MLEKEGRIKSHWDQWTWEPLPGSSRELNQGTCMNHRMRRPGSVCPVGFQNCYGASHCYMPPILPRSKWKGLLKFCYPCSTLYAVGYWFIDLGIQRSYIQTWCKSWNYDFDEAFEPGWDCGGSWDWGKCVLCGRGIWIIVSKMADSGWLITLTNPSLFPISMAFVMWLYSFSLWR